MAEEVIWSENAEEDLQNALRHLSENWIVRECEYFLDQITTTLNYVISFPEGSPRVKGRTIRERFVRPYHLMIYDISDNIVRVLALFDCRQDPKKRIEILKKIRG
ncbi:MAG: type II toxin-antitoxin system RelE/ParE family toxin [Flavobacteriales bacterium]